MDILLINPNTSDECTERIRVEGEKFKDKNININVIQAPEGPRAIETNYDELVSSMIVVEELVRLKGTYDAAIIACFSDPGLMASRELIDVPIIGIGEASLYMATMTCNRYSIIASGGKGDIAVFDEIVNRYGQKQKFASVRYLDVGVAGINFNIINRVELLINEISEKDGSDCIILGCGAFAGFGSILTNKTGLQVFDGIKQSISMAKMLLDSNYEHTSERGDGCI